MTYKTMCVKRDTSLCHWDTTGTLIRLSAKLWRINRLLSDNRRPPSFHLSVCATVSTRIRLTLRREAAEADQNSGDAWRASNRLFSFEQTIYLRNATPRTMMPPRSWAIVAVHDPLEARQIAPSVPRYAGAAALLLSALGIWWWTERHTVKLENS